MAGTEIMEEVGLFPVKVRKVSFEAIVASEARVCTHRGQRTGCKFLISETNIAFNYSVGGQQ